MNNLGIALTKCFFCGNDDKIIINTYFTKNKSQRIKEMHGKIIDTDPCPKCKKYMEKGIILIGYDTEKSDLDNLPEGFWRTGEFIVLTENGFRDLAEYLDMPIEQIENVFKQRFLFIPTHIAQQLLKQGDINEIK